MAKDPAFLFYPNDWIGGTMTFSRHLKGCYLDVLMAQFNSGPLSIECIKTVLGSDFGTSWPAIQKKFRTTEDGLFFNERLSAEKEKRFKYSESRRNNKKGKIKQKTHDISHESSCENNSTHDKSHDNHMMQRMENANIYVLSNDVLSEKDVLSDQIVDNAVCETKKKEVENFEVKKTETSENAIRGDLKELAPLTLSDKAAKEIVESKAHSGAVEAYLNSTDEERAEKSHKAFIERAKNPPPKPQTWEEIRDRSRFLKEENRKYLESLINEAIDPEYLNAMRTQFKWKCDVDQELSNFRLKVTVTAPSHYAGADLNRIRFAFQNHLSNCKNTKKVSNGNQPTALVAKCTPPYTGR